jgi:hypothetical protein
MVASSIYDGGIGTGVGIGGATGHINATTALQVRYTGANSMYGIEFQEVNSGGCAAYFMCTNTTNTGSICDNGSNGIVYNTTSDRRLKENIAPNSRGLDAELKVPVDDVNFIADPKKVRIQGLIAQDIYKAYPEAVTVGGDDPRRTRGPSIMVV